jgi:regulator of cell morphogenesis and NO signaling
MTMSKATTATTIGELVTDDTRRAQIFEQLGIDYCCGGNKSLEDACREHELHAETVLQMLQAIPEAQSRTPEGEKDPADMSLTDLIDHIESTHHEYLRRELPRIQDLLETVVKVHGDRAARMHSVRDVFNDLKPELLDHLEQEEDIVFPIIRALENEEPLPETSKSREQLIALREHEHDEAGAALAELRELTEAFTSPDWACDTFRTALASLEELESDTHRHVHKENNILFKRARTLL